MRTTGPDVSVVMVVRDAMPYLTKCIRSLVEQTIGMGRFELIAVDRGSTDGGAERSDPVRANFIPRHSR